MSSFPTIKDEKFLAPHFSTSLHFPPYFPISVSSIMDLYCKVYFFSQYRTQIIQLLGFPEVAMPYFFPS